MVKLLLCSHVKIANILQQTPEFWLRCKADGSIRIQERESLLSAT